MLRSCWEAARHKDSERAGYSATIWGWAGHIAHPGKGAEDELRSARIDAVQFLDTGEIDDRLRRLDVQLHEIVKRRAAGQEPCCVAPSRNKGANGVGRGSCPQVGEGLHQSGPAHLGSRILDGGYDAD